MVGGGGLGGGGTAPSPHITQLADVLFANHMQNANFGIQMLRISFQMIPTGLFRDEMLEKCALKRYRLPAKRPLRDFLGTCCCQHGGLKRYVLPAK